jgi:4-amino-4-deoxy-L-arabinose transferase-like glycosyltransferase
MGPDEPRYADVAREMYVSGDYITPQLAGEPWFEKPVLMYWLAAIGYALFGVGEFGARFPSALAATVSVFMIYWCGRRVFSRGVGFSAAFIMATSVGFFALARAASMDMLLTATLTSALAFFLVALNTDDETRRWYLYGFYASLGFGVLAKGPVAILLPTLILGVFMLWRGTRHEWKKWHPEGILITGLISAPWYLAVTWVNGWEFIEVFFLNHNLQRFTSEVHGHAQPFYFYAPVLLLILFPWSFALIPAIRGRYTRSEQLTLLWALVPLVFFSLSGSKLPAYILPVLPPLALLCAREISRNEITWGFRVGVVLQAALWLAAGITLGFFGDSLNLDLQINGMLALVPALLMAASLVAIAVWFPPPALGIFNVVSISVLVLVITIAVFPRVQSMESMRPWGEELEQLIAEGENVILYKPDRWMEYGLQYYRSSSPRVASSEEELAELTDSDERTLCIADSNFLDELSESDTVLIEVVSSVGDQAAFWAWSP